MEIKYDKRKWQIKVGLLMPKQDNEDCHYLDFPNNIHRCNHPKFLPNGNQSGEDTECNMNICPIICEET